MGFPIHMNVLNNIYYEKRNEWVSFTTHLYFLTAIVKKRTEFRRKISLNNKFHINLTVCSRVWGQFPFCVSTLKKGLLLSCSSFVVVPYGMKLNLMKIRHFETKFINSSVITDRYHYDRIKFNIMYKFVNLTRRDLLNSENRFYFSQRK